MQLHRVIIHTKYSLQASIPAKGVSRRDVFISRARVIHPCAAMLCTLRAAEPQPGNPQGIEYLRVGPAEARYSENTSPSEAEAPWGVKGADKEGLHTKRVVNAFIGS
ncbi:hypothetical protein NDU88_002439 [Pleurodeles waltl]|uniref:Uncharacterized protein n=1 Tax=Pleurodeles waltl TaxID=8319 RepID=A0AAV7UCE2_PLEWA|nr:hypothetical protein NDU88_002439 [Pleurodeles waltl]